MACRGLATTKKWVSLLGLSSSGIGFASLQHLVRLGAKVCAMSTVNDEKVHIGGWIY